MEMVRKMDMINWLKMWLESDDTKVIYLLALILMANMIDFLLGWINAKFNKSVSFSSSKAIYGIARKMILFMLCVFFIPISLLVPYPIGIGALYVLFIGYLWSEINSILSHLKLAEDDKSTDKFSDFVSKIFSDKGDGK
jgi:toxin secretion/phage lysis holin